MMVDTSYKSKTTMDLSIPKDVRSALTEYFAQVEQARQAYTEMMAAAFVKHTKIPPDMCMLVNKKTNLGQVEMYYIQAKEDHTQEILREVRMARKHLTGTAGTQLVKEKLSRIEKLLERSTINEHDV